MFKGWTVLSVLRGVAVLRGGLMRAGCRRAGLLRSWGAPSPGTSLWTAPCESAPARSTQQATTVRLCNQYTLIVKSAPGLSVCLSVCLSVWSHLHVVVAVVCELRVSAAAAAYIWRVMSPGPG